METWNHDDAMSFARGAALGAIDGWADNYAFAAFDREVRRLRTGSAYSDVPPLWTVTVLCPRQYRQRKHVVLYYRVARYTEAEAIEAVRETIIDERPYKGYRIIDCGRSGSSLSVYLHGSATRTPEQVEGAPTL